MVNSISSPADHGGSPQAYPRAGSALPMSFETFNARRSYAFDQAEEAYWHQRICAESYMLFRLLTRLCKERAFCWPGLEYLAVRLHASIGTIKRRLDVLERAGLIRRQQRPGGLTSYTYIQPLQVFDAGQQPSMADGSGALATDDPADALSPDHPTSNSTTRDLRGESSHPLFFVPKQGITAESFDRSALIPHTIKSPNLYSGGGGSNKQTFPATPTVRALAAGGVLSPTVLAELQHHPVPEVEACLRFAHRQRNIVDPAAFAVALLRQNMGARLLEHTSRSSRSKTDGRRSAGIALRHDHCQHDRLRGTGCAASAVHETEGTTARVASDNIASKLQLDDVSLDPGLFPCWNKVLERVRTMCLQVDYQTWLQPTALLLLDDKRAVVGTPTVFARDQVAQQFSAVLVQALHHVTGRPLAVDVVIADADELNMSMVC